MFFSKFIVKGKIKKKLTWVDTIIFQNLCECNLNGIKDDLPYIFIYFFLRDSMLIFDAFSQILVNGKMKKGVFFTYSLI